MFEEKNPTQEKIEEEASSKKLAFTPKVLRVAMRTSLSAGTAVLGSTPGTRTKAAAAF